MPWTNWLVMGNKAAIYVQLSPDVKAWFYILRCKMRYPRTSAPTQNSLAIITALSTETTLHTWYGCSLGESTGYVHYCCYGKPTSPCLQSTQQTLVGQ